MLKENDSKICSILFFAIFGLKLIAAVIFSSGYQNELFIPFIKHFLSNGGNPWQYIYGHPESGIEFPYSPGMLYILSFFYAPAHYLNLSGMYASNFFIKIPTILSDLLIYILLIRILPQKKGALLYYFACPIIIYACYLHSQIDLIPTAILFASVYLLTKNRIIFSSALLGLAIATKFHVVAAVPLLVIYALRKKSWRDVLLFILTAPAVFCLLVAPYWGDAYVQLVLSNPKQMLVYDSFIEIGNLQIYLPVLFVVLLYARFAEFRKINTDLLYMFLALVFAAFIAFTKTAPGWYVWLFPFISIFFIKYEQNAPDIRKLFFVLNIFYLMYMVVFFIPDFNDLTFLGQPLDFKIDLAKYRNISFTLLEVALLATMYSFYKFGVKSNLFYHKNAPTIIGIAGDSAAGKTTLLSDLRQLLGEKVLQLEGDADHKWERGDENWQKVTHLNPKGNHLYRQYEDLINLRYGRAIYRSDYDHQTGKFSLAQKIKAKDYIVLSGLHSFYLPKMRKVIDLKIFVDTDEKLRRHWKVLRDAKDRGHSKENILNQIQSREADSVKYIRPQHDFADVIVQYFSEDSFSTGDTNARPVIKLKLTIDSNIPLNELVASLEKQIDISWDYAEDLQTQTLVFNGHLSSTAIKKLAQNIVVNLEDLIGEEPQWVDGYRGIVQLMVLLNLTEKIKSISEHSRI